MPSDYHSLESPFLRGGFVLLTLFALVPLTAVSQDIESAVITFEQSLQKSESQEIVRGRIYYAVPDFMAFEITFPLNQMIFIRRDNTLVYYPGENKAVQLPRSQQSAFPLAEMINAAMKRDQGLTDQGFTMEEIRRETGKNEKLQVVSRWHSPERADLPQYEILLHTDTQERIIKRVDLTPEGQPAVTTRFSQFIQVKNKPFPLKVESTFHQAEGGSEIQKRILYSDVNFNREIPERIEDFSLPEDCNLKVVQW